MKRRTVAGLAAAVVLAAAAGCSSDTKTTIPTKLLDPPGMDTEGGKPGKAGKKTAPDAGAGQSAGDS